MKLSERIHNYVLENREEILKDYFDILKIPSISDTPDSYKALQHIKSVYEKNGFSAELYEDYLLSYFNDTASHKIGLFAHADVVPVDDKWTKTSPFEPKIIDGNLFARGALDDKSAVIISLYAMKAINELSIPFDSSVVAFTGGNEEKSMHDIKNYAKSHTPPDFSLVLDAGFPVHYGDKGLLWITATKEERLNDLVSLGGGSAYNIILGEAHARVKYSSELYSELSGNKELKLTKGNGEIIIYAKGISNHGANPEGTINAGGIIISALLDASSFDEGDKKKLSLLKALLTTYDGDCLGIKASDSIFGETTATNGIIDISNGKISFSLDIRHGNTYTQGELISLLRKNFANEGFSIEIAKEGDACYTDVNNKYIQACLSAYREHTGSDKAPGISVGSTYLRYIPRSCEVGMTTKHFTCDLPTGHGNAHQPNECINVEGFFEALEIIIKMLIECDKQK